MKPVGTRTLFWIVLVAGGGVRRGVLLDFGNRLSAAPAGGQLGGDPAGVLRATFYP